jgi:very-short-patch-repair endonuclease
VACQSDAGWTGRGAVSHPLGNIPAMFDTADRRLAAAALYDLPGGRTDLIELTCKRWLRARRPGVVVHESSRIESADITEVDGIPVMRPERVVLELAGLRPSPRFVEMVIQSARRKRLITYESAHAFVNQHARRGVPGVKALRSALEVWDPTQRATDSEMETRLLQLLRRSGLTTAVPQFEICDATGQLVARVDVALPDQRIAIEYDSKQEHSDEFQLAHDARRRNKIVANGRRHISARHVDLVSGGTELPDAIHAATKLR